MSEQTTKTRRFQRDMTPEERAAEVEALAEQLNEAVTALTTSEAARVGPVHPATAKNVLLLWMQAEQRAVTLTRVAGYRGVARFGTSSPQTPISDRLVDKEALICPG